MGWERVEERMKSDDVSSGSLFSQRKQSRAKMVSRDGRMPLRTEPFTRLSWIRP